MNCRVSSFTLKEPTLEVVPVAGSRTSMAPALVVNLPPAPGRTWTSSKSARSDCFTLIPIGAGQIVVVLHHDAFRIRQAAPVGDHPIVEHRRGHRQASHRRPECGSKSGAAAPNP